MEKYETIFITKSDITQKQRLALISQIQNLISRNGEIYDMQDLGLKKLAYTVHNYNEGYYDFIKFKSPKSAVEALRKLYQNSDIVLKFLIILSDSTEG